MSLKYEPPGRYLRSFDGSQFRFLYRNQCSVVVVPPLTYIHHP